MKIVLGYVSLSKTLDVTTSSTITYTNFEKENYPVEKLINISKKNLEALKEISIYNIKNDIHFYRLTSKLVPLATHNKVDFDYIEPLLTEYKEIGQLINTNNIRVDTHPDQFAVLNSTDKKIVNNTFEILEYHYKILTALGIKNPIMLLHIGSSACGKKASITRFINNFNKLPEYIKKCIAVENDDKAYNIIDTLDLCKKLNIPMVLDYHHYLCNNIGEKLEDYIEQIIDTWKNIEPKFHFSSPKSKLKKEYRSHHDYIDPDEFIKFINILKPFNKTFYIMLEAKAKDEALFRLTRQLKYKKDYVFIDNSSFII